ncbi:MAG: GNAT family N-acetyltransferase [Paracoccaceae bacterium]
MTYDIPTITTERLTLRAPTKADFVPYAEIFASDRSIYMDGPLDREDAWHGFAADIVGWQILGFGYWSVDENSTDDFVGFVGFAKPPVYPERELGWMVTPQSEGRGYAHEAALAARKFAYDTLGWSTLVSYIDHKNARSIKLAERLGCTRDDAAVQLAAGAYVYRHPSPEVLQ